MKLYILLLFFVYACDGYRLLVLFPVPGKSHGILGDGVVRHLLNAGHEVVYIQPFKKDKLHPNLTHILPVENHKVFSENTMNLELILDKKIDFTSLELISEMLFTMSSTTIQQENVYKFLTDPNQKFDLVIAEWMFSDLYAVLPTLFDCPLIWVSTIEPHWQVLRLIDEPLNPALYTDMLGGNVPPYSFYERAMQLWVQIEGQMRVSRFSKLEEEVYQKSIVPILKQRGKPVPEYSELVYNGSLMLGNSHVSMGVPTKLPPSYKDIGGYHIDMKVNPLPENLKKILDNAKDGVIYFSMGSNLKGNSIPKKLKDGLLKMFGELKQTVLWKFEEALPNLPKNVHVLEWAPQPSILAHPNTVLFITHGGLLSTTEAIQFGVPLIGIPVFADQFTNIARAQKKGFARKVDLSYNMDVELKEEIKEIMGNPTYARRAKECSLVYHDRPVSPDKELVHWVEHVIKTRGAPHLRSPALMLSWYQRAYIDLAILLFVILIIIIYILKVVINYVLSINKTVQKKKNL